MLSYKKETHTPGMPEEGGRGAPYQKGIWFLKKDHKKIKGHLPTQSCSHTSLLRNKKKLRMNNVPCGAIINNRKL